MATGDTALPLTIQPPAIEPLSDDDDGSSPLSDLGGSQNDLELQDESPNVDRDGGSDDDANDTEAETERLFPTPQNPTRHTDALSGGEVFERTPTKLRQGIRVDDDEDEPLSELQGSFTSSPPRAQSSGPPTVEKLPSPTLDILAEAAAAQNNDIRKRKRTSPPVDPLDDDQPARKRSASPATINQADQDGDVVMADDEDPSTNPNSGDETVIEPLANEGNDEQADDLGAEAQIEEESRARKGQNVSKKRKTPRAESDELTEENTEAAVAEEDGAHTGDDEQTGVDVDEEAEAAQRNEEEQRKRAALEGLTSIEKQFAIFRERLYEERLDHLNKEEAMLKADNPTHPLYLAMMECVDARRDDKLRIAENEFHLNIETLGRWAVARRAQIHSQYYQDVRETRERILGELGQYWYAIQHERRKHANNVHDFGLRFPQTQAQRVRDALSYNKEVAILSGVAKYEGMPAAPEMRGASSQELDDDFEAMNRGRRPVSHSREPTRSFISDLRGIPPFGQALGSAAEQFIEQNAWANPHHPSNMHLLQRQHSQQEPRRRSPPTETLGGRRHSQQHPFSSSTISTTSNHTPYNGNSSVANYVPRAPTTSPETTRAASLLEQTSIRSMKAAATAAAAAESEQGRAVKREAAPPVGGF